MGPDDAKHEVDTLADTYSAQAIVSLVTAQRPIMAQEGPTARPLLLPLNRRLRHLKGIYLRNLVVTHPRSTSIDDVTLNKSPGKLEALREHELQQTRSSDTLDPKMRPGRPRRRSTVWAGQSPGFRQKKLEDVIEAGMADTFFSLHCDGVDDPIYVSEIVTKTMVSCNSPSTAAMDAFCWPAVI